MKKLLLLVCAAACMTALQAQPINKKGGLSMEQVNTLRSTYQANPTNKALRNAINANEINKLAVNYDNKTAFDPNMSNVVPSKAITNQESSGRC